MKVEEIKAKLPLAEIYEMHPDAKYIFVIDRTMPINLVRATAKWLQDEGIKGVLFIWSYSTRDMLKIFELDKE